MALKLRVISDHYKALGKRSSRLFGVSGGRIGRAQDNDWVLPDPERYVSSHHAKVTFRSGAWVLEDTSTNGIFINGADTPVSMEGPYALQDGDRLRLGDYDIVVSIDDRNDFPPDASGQMPVPKRVKENAAQAAIPDDLGEELDITDLLSDAGAKPAPAPYDLKAFSAGGPPKADAVPGTAPIPAAASAQPRPAAAAKPAAGGFSSLLDNLINDDEPRTVVQSKKDDDWPMQTRPYDRSTMRALATPSALGRPAERADAPSPTPAPERPPQRRSTDLGELASGVEAFCRGAGIDPAALPADAQAQLLTVAGQILREAVLGLTEALKGRSDLKSRLRLSQTTIQPGENNPLKFSASVDEAVLRLLDPHSARYLGPIETIRESFADLRNHQTALVAAIQAGIDEFMNRIEPGELQDRFDRGLKRGALLGAANKLKYWDLYVEFYQTLNQRNDQGLPPVFAEELARTYAEKLVQKRK
jgi:type VI secretion system protein